MQRNAANNVSQARKSARRLIRPRIEPAGQQESALESGEITGEGTSDNAEADVEFVEQGKPSGGGGDAAEPAPTSGTQMGEVVTPVTESALQPSSLMNSDSSVSAYARKRPLMASNVNPAEESGPEQEVRIESAPPSEASTTC